MIMLSLPKKHSNRNSVDSLKHKGLYKVLPLNMVAWESEGDSRLPRVSAIFAFTKQEVKIHPLGCSTSPSSQVTYYRKVAWFGQG